MRFAKPTLAIASSAFTALFTLVLLMAAFNSIAQPTTANRYVADCGLGATAATPKGPSSTATTTSLSATTNLSKFYELVELAGLRNRLRRPTEAITVFAPTNQAMSMMAAPIRERIKQVGTPVIKSLVRTHLAEGILTFDQLTDGKEIEMFDGRKLRVTRRPDGTVLLDGIYQLRDSGQRTTNGIIYTLDTVITPS